MMSSSDDYGQIITEEEYETDDEPCGLEIDLDYDEFLNVSQEERDEPLDKCVKKDHERDIQSKILDMELKLMCSD